MKTIIPIVTIIAIAAIFVGCKLKSADTLGQVAGIVVFPEAGVSLDVGDGWQRIDISPGLPICPPTLVGSHGMVRAMLFAPGISDLEAATNEVRSMFDGDSNAVKDSYHQDGFTTDSGLQGQHILYSTKTTTNGRMTESRSHSFIVQRQDGHFVAISYITVAGSDSDAVHQMIQKSLRLQ